MSGWLHASSRSGKALGLTLPTVRRLVESRTGVLIGLGLIVACFSLSALFFVRQFEALESQKSELQGLKLREGFVALSDLQRVNLAVLDALREGAMTPERTAELEAAVDFLYVRSEAFRQRILPEAGSELAAEALGQMDLVIDLTDAARDNGYRDLFGLSGALIAATDEARRLLILYLDEKRRRQDLVIAEQHLRISRQVIMLVGFLSGLTIVSMAALLLFRREMQLRRIMETSERRAHYLAYYDALTGLPNRVLFKDRVTDSLSESSNASMFFADLDKFKEINDTLGHAAGDAVLKAVGKYMNAFAAQRGGIAARLSGDEFALFLPAGDPATLKELGEDLLAVCRSPVVSEAGHVTPGISIGAAVGGASESAEAGFDALLRMADFALYAAKSAGRGRVAVFDGLLEAQFNRRRALTAQLPRAIRQREISVFFQPKLQIEPGSVYGFEAVARWERPDEMLQPEEFIELAEASGSVIDLDMYILRESVGLIADWNRRMNTSLSVSVNLSAAHFRNGSVADEIARALASSGLRSDLLTLEITETVQILNGEQVRSALARIRTLGCKISIDDFGSGYSSLAYLRAMQADELKIDRSLVAEIETSEEARFILDSVVDLAHSLGMEVVVEGVETAQQLCSITALGCRRAQGFLIGRPIPAQDALASFGLPRPQVGAAGRI